MKYAGQVLPPRSRQTPIPGPLSQDGFADFLANFGLGGGTTEVDTNGGLAGGVRSNANVENTQNVEEKEEEETEEYEAGDEEIAPWDLSAEAFSHSINDFAQNFYAKVCYVGTVSECMEHSRIYKCVCRVGFGREEKSLEAGQGVSFSFHAYNKS